MNRRHFFRSAGVTLGLPFFESLASADPAAAPPRFVFIYTPNGYLQGKLLPETVARALVRLRSPPPSNRSPESKTTSLSSPVWIANLYPAPAFTRRPARAG